jgi:hypothetical protein
MEKDEMEEVSQVNAQPLPPTPGPGFYGQQVTIKLLGSLLFSGVLVLGWFIAGQKWFDDAVEKKDAAAMTAHRAPPIEESHPTITNALESYVTRENHKDDVAEVKGLIKDESHKADLWRSKMNIKMDALVEKNSRGQYRPRRRR